MTAFVLQGYAWGLLGTGAFNFVQRYYYSLNNYRKPFCFAVLCAALDVVLSLWLKETPLRVAGLAWANTISFTLCTCIMLADIKIHSQNLSIIGMIKDMGRIAVSVAAGLVPLLLFLHFCGTWWEGGLSLTYLALFLTVCALFAGIVLVLYKALGLNALFMAWFFRKSKKL